MRPINFLISSELVELLACFYLSFSSSLCTFALSISSLFFRLPYSCDNLVILSSSSRFNLSLAEFVPVLMVTPLPDEGGMPLSYFGRVESVSNLGPGTCYESSGCLGF